jgi:glycosyltransferase involved in cell wall biosynthesis
VLVNIPDIQFLSKLPISGYGTTEMRCVQPAAYLSAAGWSVKTACVYRQMPVAEKIIVFHRVVADTMTLRAMRIARAMGCMVLYDIDDLLFEGEAEIHLAQISAGNTTQSVAGGYLKAIASSDLVTCSTTYLRDRIRQFHPSVKIMRNGLSADFVETAQKTQRVARDPQPITLGYFSGSKHHDHDFAIIQPALLRLLYTEPQARLLLVGKLNYDQAFLTFGDRFEYRPFVPYKEFMAIPGEVDVNLAPLDVEDPFAQARSALKYIEAGAFGVPTVASPTQTYVEAIKHKENGLLSDKDSWFDMLSLIFADMSLRHRLGQAARADVLENYGPNRRCAEWGRLMAGVMQDRHNQRPQSVSRRERAKHWAAIQKRSLKRNYKALRSV